MHYFVFQINNHREYRCLEQFSNYRDARVHVRNLRESAEEPGIVEFKMVFAENEAEASDLLRTRRERTPSEDD